ncbi:hypothetical protein FRX31_026494, partial [Thalictrum thalictroides]
VIAQSPAIFIPEKRAAASPLLLLLLLSLSEQVPCFRSVHRETAVKKPSSGDRPPLPSVLKLGIELEVHIIYKMPILTPKSLVMTLNFVVIIGSYRGK